MSDYISRQAAIDAIMKKPAWHGSDGSYYHSSDIRQALESLPSAQPERKKGNWFKLNMATYNYQCSECEKYSRAMYDFCPNCGADMRSRSC